MVKYFLNPFATAGDKTAIPNDVQVSGSVSYASGWGLDYQKNLATDPTAKPVPRSQTNQLMYDITQNIQQYQQHGVPEFITTADNGGVPFPYSKYAIVRYDSGSGFNLYISLTDSNTSLPSDTLTWSSLDDYISNRGLQYFTANGNFVVPPRVKQIQVEVWGGGGGGASGTGVVIGNGGGGGGYGMSILSVTPGDTIPVVIGAGGTGGIFGAGGHGGNGGTTSFNGLAVTADGGIGATAGGSSGGAGGGANAQFPIIGQAGCYGGGSPSIIFPPFGGSSGRGGLGAVPSAGATSPGGGGDGGAVSMNGGPGAAGGCLVTW